MQVLMVAVVAAAGCSPSWYQRDADRQIAEIVEKRKEETLGYKPQTVAPVTTSDIPKKAAYEKVPVTAMPDQSIVPLSKIKVEPVVTPLGPKVPAEDEEEERLNFVPESYANYAVSIERMGPPAPGSIQVSLDLIGSIEYGVSYSRDYQDQMEELYLRTLDVTLQRHLFDPIPFANTTFKFSGDQGGTTRTPYQPGYTRDYQSALSAINSVGVRQQLPYGGQIEAAQLVQFVHALNDTTTDGDSAQTALSATIPLLKGAGMVNLEGLINAERQLVYAVRAFETYRRAFAVSVSRQYFGLVSQQQGIRNRRQSYENLKVLAERSMELFAASKLGFLDVQRAQQNLLQSENELIDSINQYQASLDSFKIVLGMPVEADLDIVSVELKVDTPDLNENAAAGTAMKYRLDLQTTRDQVDDARRGVDNAKNGLLPDVNVFARGGVGNMDGDPVNKYNSDSSFYSTGVRIDWPLDKVAERNAYRRSLITLEQSYRSYVQAREQVIADVRQITRAIRLALVTVEIQKRSVELNRRRLDLANEKLIQGTGQVLDFVDAQSALLNAQDSLDRARANLQTQLLQYLRDTGTLRINPSANELGRAMDRAVVMQRDAAWFREIEQKLKDVQK